ncbi:MAG: hypothetical protein DCF31_15665 [Alphaproteobacteria bacterium]|nr:MAG: hypothetical protein DCF31_15665 [Alphaproteobacteria bacterium]
MSDGQTVKLTPVRLRTALATTLAQDGLRIRTDATGPRLLVGVIAYDSGPYLGFSKKATMTLSYRLDVPDLPATTWTDTCQAKAGVDMQDPDARNRLAVDMCLATLASQLSSRLLSPPGETIVQ